MGRNGRIFTLYKIRTMVHRAEEATGAVWCRANDARVTPLGKILRRFHLDEFPQLLNVVKGEMSLVGPRPERPELVERLSELIPFYDLRHLVSPGLTGCAQINYPYGASVRDAKVKLQYDLYYIKFLSLFLDLQIILRTFSAMLRGSR